VGVKGLPIFYLADKKSFSGETGRQLQTDNSAVLTCKPRLVVLMDNVLNVTQLSVKILEQSTAIGIAGVGP